MVVSIAGFIALALTSVSSAEPQPAGKQAVRPPIVQRPIPFGADRKREMAAYSKRHYGKRSYRLTHPRVIVEHYTVTTTLSSAYNTFASNDRDPELHELPGVRRHSMPTFGVNAFQLFFALRRVVAAMNREGRKGLRSRGGLRGRGAREVRARRACPRRAPRAGDHIVVHIVRRGKPAMQVLSAV